MSYETNYENFRYQNPDEQYLEVIRRGGSIRQGGEATDFPQYSPRGLSGANSKNQLLTREEVARAERRFWAKRGGLDEIFSEWKNQRFTDKPKTWRQFKKNKVASKRMHQSYSKSKKNV